MDTNCLFLSIESVSKLIKYNKKFSYFRAIKYFLKKKNEKLLKTHKMKKLYKKSVLIICLIILSVLSTTLNA